MSRITNHAMGEQHLVHRTGWLRAAVLGAMTASSRFSA